MPRNSGVSWDQPLGDVIVTCTEYMTHEGCIPHTSDSIAARHHEVMLRHQHVVNRFGEPDLWVILRGYLIRVQSVPRTDLYNPPRNILISSPRTPLGGVRLKDLDDVPFHPDAGGPEQYRDGARMHSY